MAHLSGTDRSQMLLLPEVVDDYVGADRETRSGALTALPGYEPVEIGTYRYLRRSESKVVRRFCSWLDAEIRKVE
ncbi:hypothetical protein HGO34_21485 [Agrobacterium vitis]|uniref:Transcriptional regulator n=2 Tax=Agrobacterium vitis TaxID=373 RepID=A0AAE5AWQ1_AGRVI|nr:hypothetical protein [Allorhizobium sp. Av2]MCM2442291.1 hypothetical protein [Agrobacterium vitis]MUZ58701.1 hypothetical protein [Agrobacterium vitis]MVA66336.1 hypothetical protein [Agrobacterium vitis]MVA88373.1 hypothetical protein [Agrobacterium vitis]